MELETTGQAATAATANEGELENDLYMEYKKLSKQLEFLQVQEDYIKVRCLSMQDSERQFPSDF